MSDTGGWYQDSGTRRELDDDAKLSQNNVATFTRIKGAITKDGAPADRAVSVIIVLIANCIRAKVKRDGRKDTRMPVVVEVRELLEELIELCGVITIELGGVECEHA